MYTNLPGSNSGFGDRTLKLSHPDASGNDAQEVKIFFAKTATNHAGTGSGTTPNWYYYWKDAGVGTGTHQHNANLVSDGQYTCGDNYFEIGPTAYSQDYGYYVAGNGIDNFGSTCLHENAHKTYFLSAWSTWSNYLSKRATEDLDRDLIKDSDESGLGYDPTKKGTPTSTYCTSDDNEDYACKAESGWTNGSSDSQDWSSPGHQSNYFFWR